MKENEQNEVAKTESAEAAPGTLGGWFKKIGAFFGEVGVEFRKTTWPDSHELVESTVVVLALIVILAVVVFAFDKAIIFALDLLHKIA